MLFWLLRQQCDPEQNKQFLSENIYLFIRIPLEQITKIMCNAFLYLSASVLKVKPSCTVPWYIFCHIMLFQVSVIPKD